MNSLAGVVFLGTPHSGSLYAAFGYILAHLKYWNGSSTQLLGVIEYNSEKARKLEHDFSQSYKRLPTKDFFETKYVTWLDISVTPVSLKHKALSDALTTRRSSRKPLQHVLDMNRSHSTWITMD